MRNSHIHELFWINGAGWDGATRPEPAPPSLNHNFQSHDDHPNPSCPDDDFFEFLPDPTADLVGWRSESLTPTTAAASRSSHMSGSYLSMKMTSPARSKKHACLFRLPKFPPEMELSDMRRRQSRRTPAPLLSTENDGEVVDGSGRRESGPAEELLERGCVWLHFSSLKSVWAQCIITQFRVWFAVLNNIINNILKLKMIFQIFRSIFQNLLNT